jgi:hypothetical protein
MINNETFVIEDLDRGLSLAIVKQHNLLAVPVAVEVVKKFNSSRFMNGAILYDFQGVFSENIREEKYHYECDRQGNEPGREPERLHEGLPGLPHRDQN